MQSDDSMEFYSCIDSLQISDVVMTESNIASSLDILEVLPDLDSTLDLEEKFGPELVEHYPSDVLKEYAKVFDIKNVFPWQVSCLTNKSVLENSKFLI